MTFLLSHFFEDSHILTIVRFREDGVHIATDTHFCQMYRSDGSKPARS